jgi:SRSO17 transposase
MQCSPIYGATSSVIWVTLMRCWFVDETGDLKKGANTVGVQRQ